MHTIGESGGFLSKRLRQLLKSGLPLIANVLKTLAKSVFILLRLTAAASVIDTTIHKKLFGSGVRTLIISDKEMNDNMKIVKYFDESVFLIKDVSQIIKNKAKVWKRGFLGMLLET